LTAPQKASAGDMSGHVPSKASLSYCQASLRRHCPDQVIRVTGKNRFLSVRSPSNIFNNHTVMQRSPSVKKISVQAQRGAGKGLEKEPGRAGSGKRLRARERGRDLCRASQGAPSRPSRTGPLFSVIMHKFQELPHAFSTILT